MRGNAEGSTLRLTLGCLLAGELGLQLRRVGTRADLHHTVQLRWRGRRFTLRGAGPGHLMGTSTGTTYGGGASPCPNPGCGTDVEHSVSVSGWLVALLLACHVHIGASSKLLKRIGSMPATYWLLRPISRRRSPNSDHLAPEVDTKPKMSGRQGSGVSIIFKERIPQPNIRV